MAEDEGQSPELSFRPRAGMRIGEEYPISPNGDDLTVELPIVIPLAGLWHGSDPAGW